MSIRLIINADDYGRSAEVSRGIRQSHMEGVVTSTTCMVNLPTTEDDIRLARRDVPGLGLGVHLVLTCGVPVLPPEQVPTLVNEQGEFPNATRFIRCLDAGEIDIEQVKVEWHAQVAKFITAAGRTPTHLDSHHHTSYASEGLFRGMLELAQEYGCAIRLPGLLDLDMPGLDNPPGAPHFASLLAEFLPSHPDIFIASFYDQTATKPHLVEIIESLSEGASEIMCHPGYVDEDLLSSSGYSRQRADELAILTDPVIKQLVHDRGIELISFDQL